MTTQPDLWDNGLRGRIDAVKTEYVVVLLALAIVVANKYWGLGLDVVEILGALGLSGIYSVARAADKRAKSQAAGG